MPEQRRPPDRPLFLDGIGFDPGQFLRRQPLLLARAAVETEPRRQPHHRQQPGQNEGPAPAQRHRDDRHHQRRQDRADIGPGVEDADGQGAFLLGEPFVGRGDRSGKSPRLADRQRNARQQHPGGRGEEDMRDMADGPQRHGKRIAGPRPDLVDQPAKGDIGDAIARLEPNGEVGIAALAPAIARLQVGLERRQHQPVNIAQHHRREEQAADDPAHLAGRLCGAGGC